MSFRPVEKKSSKCAIFTAKVGGDQGVTKNWGSEAAPDWRLSDTSALCAARGRGRGALLAIQK